MEFSENVFKRRIADVLPSDAFRAAVCEPPQPSRQAGTPSRIHLGDLLLITSDEDFVQETHRRILGRECNASEFGSTLELLRKQVSRRIVARDLAKSEEARRRGMEFVGLTERRSWLKRPRVPLRLFSAKNAVGLLAGAVRRAWFTPFTSIDNKLSLVLREIAVRSEATNARSEAIMEALSHRLTAQLESLQARTPGPQPPADGRLNAHRHEGNIVAELDGLHFSVPAHRWRDAAEDAFAALAEPGIALRLGQLLRPGMTVVQAGARFGFLTVRLAQWIGAEGRIHAFEPSQDFPILRQTLALNGLLRSVSLYQEAFGDQALPGQPHCDVVILDAKGAGPSAIQALGNLLAAHPQVRVLVAFHPACLSRSGENPEDFWNQLHALGRKVSSLDSETGELSAASYHQVSGRPRTFLELPPRESVNRV